MKPLPPRLFLRFFRWYCHPRMVDHIEGDLLEVYLERAANSGKRKADWNFIIDVILLCRPGIIRPLKTNTYSTPYGMYKNYFKTAIRNMWRYKGYSTINIFGLAVGMAVALFVGLWVQNQLNVDGFHTNKKNIAIVMKRTFFNNTKGTQVSVMLPLYDELKANYPEVKRITRMDWGETHGLMVGEKRIAKDGHFVDPDFLKMFTFPLVKGDPDKALSDPYSIVLTESLATALFGEQDPIGKIITLDKTKDVVVTGVAKDVPPNSTIGFNFLLPYELNVATTDFVKGARDQWRNNFLRTLVELHEGVTMEAFSKKVENIVREKTNDNNESTLFVHPLEKWHLYSEFKDWENVGGGIRYVRLFSIIGLLVLAIACINFMNLSTARSEKRAREVGIRKVMGSQRKQLIFQFFGESLLTAFFALVIAIIMVKLAGMIFKQEGIAIISPGEGGWTVLFMVISGCIVTGLFAGCYPALYLSSFSPVKVMKGVIRYGRSADLPRKILVVIQFSFSIALIIGTIVVLRQIKFAKDRPLGYDPSNLILMYLTPELKTHYDALKNEFLATGYVEALAQSSSPMTGVYNQWSDYSWPGKDPDMRISLSSIMVDQDYQAASGVVIREGRFFSHEHMTDSSAVVINESAVKLMGLNKPVGSTIEFGEEKMTVIGVSQDVVMQDPFQPVRPAVMLLRPYFRNLGLVRLKNDVDIPKALATIQPIVEKLNPGFPFDYQFTDEAFLSKFRDEDRVGKLAGTFSCLSIFISCLGLFGLASFMAERRTKEIGIRKVVGASVFALWKMLSTDFVVLVIIACGIAMPISYYLMTSWLTQYEYRIDVSWWILMATAAAAFVITLLTVSYQSIRASTMNPVKSLRTE